MWERSEIDPDSGCWLWTGCVLQNGYGQKWWDGKPQYVHRLSLWAFKDFDLTSDLHGLHKCDTPRCCNPDHLFPGTPKENSDDKIRKGRYRRKELYEGELVH